MPGAIQGQSFRIGLIGCGRAAETHHLPALAGIPDIEVAAVADVDGKRLERVAARFGIPTRHTDHRALLDDPRLDAVGVCVPPESHVEVALSALEADKHLLVEKPLALEMGEARRLIERAGDSERRAMMGFNLRWHRLIRDARRVLEEGRLGRVRSARSVFTSTLQLGAALPAWRKRPELGGTALLEIGIHHFDLWRMLLQSEVEEVFAVADEGRDTAGVTARMANGVIVESLFSDAIAPAHELEIYGDAAMLRVSFYRFDGLEVREASTYPGSPVVRLKGAASLVRNFPTGLLLHRRGGDLVASFAAEWSHFASAVRSDAPVEATLEEGGRALEIALAAAESASSGRSVRIPPAPDEAPRSA